MAWPEWDIAEVPLPGSDEVAVFRLRAGEREAERFVSLLSPAERERAGRLRVETARREFIAGRGTLRVLLGRATGIDPATIAFGQNEAGKPFLLSPVFLSRIQERPAFNVAHSGGEVLLALGDVPAIGVDLERVRREIEALEIAGDQFSAGEYEALAGADVALRPALFFELWTGKEAVLKAQGEGLRVPLRDVPLRLGESPQTVRLSDTAGGGLFTVRWLDAGEGWKAAVAVGGEPRPVYTAMLRV